MGSLVVDGTSDVGASANMGRAIHELSNGNTLVCVLNGASMLVYTSPDRVTWTLKDTLAGLFGTFSTYSTAIGPDNSLHVVFRDPTGAFKYVKCTYSAGSYSTGTAEVVKTGTNISLCDIDVLDVGTAGVPIIAGFDVTSPATLRLFVRRTSDNTWINFRSIKVSNNSHTGPQGVTIARGLNQVDTTAHTATFAVACLAGDTSFQTGDLWVAGASLNYQTGASVANGFSQTTVFAGINKATIRSYQLFSVGTDRWDLVCVVGNGSIDARVARIASTGFIQSYSKLPFNIGTPANRAITGTYSELAAAHNGESIVIVYQGKRANVSHTCNIHARVSDQAITWVPPNNSNPNSGFGDFWDSNIVSGVDLDTQVTHIFGGGNRNLGVTSSKRISIATSTASTFHWYYRSNDIKNTPKNLTPGLNSTVAVNTPALSATINTAGTQQSRRKAIFQIAKDSAFTTNLVTVVQSDSAYVVVPPTGTVTFSYTVKLSEELSQGTWFLRSATMDAWGLQSGWSAATSFVVTHPPSAIARSPNSEVKLLFGSGNASFNWDFKSAQVDSRQTAYELLIETDTSEGAAPATVFDSGKVASTDTTATTVVDFSFKAIPLKWSVKVWDEDNVSGVYSQYATFKMVDASVINVTSPADFDVVNNPTPDIVWVFTGSSGTGGPVVDGGLFPGEDVYPDETVFPGGS